MAINFRLTAQDVEELRQKLIALGPAGEQAFRGLADKSPQLANALEQARRKADEARAAMESAGNLGARAFANGADLVASGLRGLAAGAAAYLSLNFAQELYQTGRAALDSAGGLGELAESAAISARELQVLIAAGVQAGAKVEDITTGLGKFAVSVTSAATKGGEAATMFAKLGVATQTTAGGVRDTFAVLTDFAEALSKVESPAERVALAKEALGKGGAKLVPILSQGAEGLAKFEAVAKRLGLLLEDEVVKSSDDTGDSFAVLDLKSQRLAERIAEQVMPTVLKAKIGFQEWFASMLEGPSAIDKLTERLEILRNEAARQQRMTGRGGFGAGEIARLEAELEAAREGAALGRLNPPKPTPLDRDPGRIAPTDADRKAVDDAAKRAEAFDKVITGLERERELTAATAEQRERLAAQFKAIDALQKPLNDAEQRRFDLAFDGLEAEKKRVELEKQAAETLRVQEEKNQKLADYITNAQEEARLAGISKELLKEHAALLEAKRIKGRELEVQEQEAVRNAVALKEANEKAVREAERAAQETVKFWDRAAERIGDGLADALVEGFDRGQSGIELFANAFKRLMLQSLGEVLSAQFFRPAISSVFSSLGLGSGASAAGGGGVAGGVGQAAGNGLWNMIFNAGGYTGMGEGLASGFSGIASALGFGGAAAGAGMLSVGGAAAGAAGIGFTGTAGAAMGIGAGASASAGVGLMGTIGAAMPYLAPVAIAGLLASSFLKKKPSVGPNESAGWFLDPASGRLSARLTGADNGGGGGPTLGYASEAARVLNDLAGQLGTSVTPAAEGGIRLLQGQLGFSASGLNYANGTSAETAVADIVRDAITRGALAGVSEVDDELIAAAIGGKLEEALAASKARELSSELQQTIALQERYAEALASTAGNIRTFLDEFRFSEDSSLTGEQRLQAARGYFADLVGRGNAGDIEAAQAAPGAFQAVLRLQRAYSPASYANTEQAGLMSLGGLADSLGSRAATERADLDELINIRSAIAAGSANTVAAVDRLRDEMRGFRADLNQWIESRR